MHFFVIFFDILTSFSSLVQYLCGVKQKKCKIMANAVTMYGASNESVVVYQSEDGTLKLNVQLKEESVWLTQEQIATLFVLSVLG